MRNFEILEEILYEAHELNLVPAIYDLAKSLMCSGNFSDISDAYYKALCDLKNVTTVQEDTVIPQCISM